MLKNAIIGVLVVLSIFFFFYGLTQQIKAEHCHELLLKTERASLQQKKILEAALVEAQKKTELARQDLDAARK